MVISAYEETKNKNIVKNNIIEFKKEKINIEEKLIKEPLIDKIAGDYSYRYYIKKEDVENAKKIINYIKKTHIDKEKASCNDLKKDKEIEDIIKTAINDDRIIENLVLIKRCNNYTFYHSLNTFKLSLLIGYEIGIKQNDLLDLGYSAILHDTGKIFVDCKMLNKKNKLTKEEFENIKKHPSKGYTYLKNKYNFSKKILEGVLYHHERWNGEGYEAKISGDKIPNYAYIIAVADVFDALTTKRIYRNKWSINIALSYINKNSSVLFSPAVVESLNKITKHKPG